MGVLKKLVITATGDVEPKCDVLKRWVENNGGRWVSRMQKGVTHLICSKDNYKDGIEAGMSFLSYVSNSRHHSHGADPLVKAQPAALG